jgi:hypothetical protein
MFAIFLLIAAGAALYGVRLAVDVLGLVPRNNDDLVFF